MTQAASQTPWRIEFYATSKSKSPVVDFINELPASERAKASNVLRLLREFGTLLGLPHAQPMTVAQNYGSCGRAMYGCFTSLTPGGVLSWYMAFAKSHRRHRQQRLPPLSGA